MIPLVRDIVMPFVNETPMLAVEPMICTEAIAASVIESWESEQLVSVVVGEVIIPLFLG